MDKKTDHRYKAWAEDIKNSDSEAFDALFRELYPRLIHFACGYTHDKQTASDLTQDAFIALWQNRRNINPDDSIKAYLYMTVRNKALNYLRNHGNKTVRLESIQKTELAEKSSVNININLKSDEEAQKLAGLFKDWIQQLPQRQQEAFSLSRFEGFDHEEIAEIMEVSKNTVNNHITTALTFLKDCYDEYKSNK